MWKCQIFFKELVKCTADRSATEKEDNLDKTLEDTFLKKDYVFPLELTSSRPVILTNTKSL